jgi:hypothetical protein
MQIGERCHYIQKSGDWCGRKNETVAREFFGPVKNLHLVSEISLIEAAHIRIARVTRGHQHDPRPIHCEHSATVPKEKQEE